MVGGAILMLLLHVLTGSDKRQMSSSSASINIAPTTENGTFVKPGSHFKDFIRRGGEFPPDNDRYHLYVSYACPWAHRALIVRKMKGLEDIIPITSVHWHMGEKGWRFVTPDDKDAPGDAVQQDPVNGHQLYTHLREIYTENNPGYDGRVSVPILYDTKQGRIVSGESIDIMRMFYTEFDDLLDEPQRALDLYPASLRERIDEADEWIQSDINGGVYKAGFATTQEAYASAVVKLFQSLDDVEHHLGSSDGPYYFGKDVTETDIRLYTTMIRFDVVYVQHFKTNLRDIRSGYPHIHKWLRHLYWNIPAFKDTVNFLHIKNHYTKSHPYVNPLGITPLGPDIPIMKEDEEVRAVSFAEK
ncbi:hypothetical protein D6D06_08327 [Aureobasidium pullulans]|nr:hypothetical protein D6D06_08327 [Aureobasidium pullulans]